MCISLRWRRSLSTPSRYLHIRVAALGQHSCVHVVIVDCAAPRVGTRVPLKRSLALQPLPLTRATNTDDGPTFQFAGLLDYAQHSNQLVLCIYLQHSFLASHFQTLSYLPATSNILSFEIPWTALLHHYEFASSGDSFVELYHFLRRR